MRVEEGPEGPVITTEGQYQLAKAPPAGADVPRKLPIRFRRRIEYRQWGIVACELEIMCDEPLDDVVEVVAMDIVLREGMTDCLVRDNPDAGTTPDGTGFGKWLEPPRSQAGLLQRPGADTRGGFRERQRGAGIHARERPFQVGHGTFFPNRAWVTTACSRIGEMLANTLISLSPYCMAYRRNAIKLEGSYKLRYYITLPFIKDRQAIGSPYFHTSADSRWLSDAQLEKMAKSGIKLIRFHNDYREGGAFWHDGQYPPYDAAGMGELRRMIDTCHRLGMKIIPYISVKEFHPEAADFASNYQACARKQGPNFRDLHTWYGSGEFGQLMCLESGWLEFRKKSIDIILNDLPWDGLYFDWCTPHACRHPEHVGGVTHIDQDAFLDFMRWCRERVGPDRIIMTHLSGLPQIAIENLSDIAFIFEDQGPAVVGTDPSQFPIQCTFMPIARRQIQLAWGKGLERRRCGLAAMLQGHPPVPAATYFGETPEQVIADFLEEFAHLRTWTSLSTSSSRLRMVSLRPGRKTFMGPSGTVRAKRCYI